MARYKEPAAGEWVRPIVEGYKFACCDCGLVHRIDFRTADDGLPEFRVFRDNRATGQMRRHMKLRYSIDHHWWQEEAP